MWFSDLEKAAAPAVVVAAQEIASDYAVDPAPQELAGAREQTKTQKKQAARKKKNKKEKAEKKLRGSTSRTKFIERRSPKTPSSGDR